MLGLLGVEVMSDIRIIVSNKLYVSGLPPHFERAVIKDLTLENPEYRTRQRMVLLTDETPDTLTLAERSAGALVLPRGYIEVLLQRCEKACKNRPVFQK